MGGREKSKQVSGFIIELYEFNHRIECVCNGSIGVTAEDSVVAWKVAVLLKVALERRVPMHFVRLVCFRSSHLTCVIDVLRTRLIVLVTLCHLVDCIRVFAEVYVIMEQ